MTESENDKSIHSDLKRIDALEDDYNFKRRIVAKLIRAEQGGFVDQTPEDILVGFKEKACADRTFEDKSE